MLRNEKGVALFVSLMVLIMLTLIGMAAIMTTTTEVNIAGNEKFGAQALYLAEAGVSVVKAFFEKPSSFNPAGGLVKCFNPADDSITTANCTNANHNDVTNTPGTWPTNFFDRRRKDADDAPSFISVAGHSQFLNTNNDATVDTNNFYDDGDGGGCGVGYDLTPNKTGDLPALRIDNVAYINDTLLGGAFSEMGQINQIEIYPPFIGCVAGNYAVVRVTAVSGGAIRVIEQEIGPSIFIPITAAAQAGGGGAWNGSGAPHWGDVRIERDPSIPAGDPTVSFTNLNHIPCNDGTPADGCTSGSGVYDEWFDAYVEGRVSPGGAGWPNTDPVVCPDVNTCEDPSQTIKIHQNQANVDIDRLDYDDLKTYAKEDGNYYVVCIDGAGVGDPPPSVGKNDAVIFRGSCGSTGGMTFAELTHTKTYDLFFIDWYNTATSTAATSNTPGFVLNQSGGGGYWTVGNLYINGGLDMSGLGAGRSTVPTALRMNPRLFVQGWPPPVRRMSISTVFSI
jgi:hypothetical protein